MTKTKHTTNEKGWFVAAVRVCIILALLFFSIRLLRFLVLDSKMDDYMLSENLLFYAGGIIRRSGMGNLIILLPSELWERVIATAYISTMAALLIFTIRYCRSNYMLLIFLCIPFGFRLYTVANVGLYRKEALLFSLVLICLYLFKKNGSTRTTLIISFTGSILMMMVHETFLFLGAPVIIWLLYKFKSGFAVTGGYILLLIGSFLIFSKTPDPEQISLLDQFFRENQIDWSQTRHYMTMTKKETLDMSLNHIMGGSIIFFLLFYIPIIAYFAQARLFRKEFLILFMVQNLFCFALCLVATDYGRWLSFSMACFLLCLIVFTDLADLNKKISSSVTQKFLYSLLIVFMLSINIPKYIDIFDLPSNLKEHSNLNFVSKLLSRVGNR